MNARILQTLKREHPSTILAESMDKPVAVESTGTPVAVTSTSESKELPHSTVQQQDNTQKEGSQKVDSSIWNASKSRSAESRPGKGSRVQPIQREVEGHDLQHGTHWSTSRCAHDCSTYWTTGIENCTCGTCLRPSDEIRKLNKDRFDVLSIPNYVIKNTTSSGRDPPSSESSPPSLQIWSYSTRNFENKAYNLLKLRSASCVLFDLFHEER